MIDFVLCVFFHAVKNKNGDALTAGAMHALVRELGGAPANDKAQNRTKVMKAFKDAEVFAVETCSARWSRPYARCVTCSNQRSSLLPRFLRTR